MARTVMVIEDHEATRESLAVILRRHGYDVVALANGRQALERLAVGPPPDVILMDMLMPVLDGWHLLKRLKGGPHANIPIIITTGTILTSEWAAMQGCAGFVKKPVQEEDLLDELRSVLPPSDNN